jgi:hypothetical protein
MRSEQPDDRRLDVRRSVDRLPAREFIDSRQVRWCVYESPRPCADGTTRPGSLIFESDGVIRRVRDFPVDWRTLTDAELEALSWCT